RSQQERLVGRKFERHAFVKLVPDQSVQGPGILRSRREWINDQKVDPASEEVARFRDEFVDGSLAGLVPWRHDLLGCDPGRQESVYGASGGRPRVSTAPEKGQDRSR